jgi:hypothetical protein
MGMFDYADVAVGVISPKRGKWGISALFYCSAGGKNRYNELELGLPERLLI